MYPVSSTISSRWDTWEQSRGVKVGGSDSAEMLWPAHLHWERPARDANHGAAVEVGGELVAVHRGAHKDKLQVRSPHDDVFQDGKQEVWLDAAFMDLMGRRREEGGVSKQANN